MLLPLLLALLLLLQRLALLQLMLLLLVVMLLLQLLPAQGTPQPRGHQRAHDGADASTQHWRPHRTQPPQQAKTTRLLTPRHPWSRRRTSAPWSRPRRQGERSCV